MDCVQKAGRCRNLKENAIDGYSIGGIESGFLKIEAVLDLNYLEDSHAMVDCNLVMTGSGELVEIQGTGEERPFRKEELQKLIALGEIGNQTLRAAQLAAMEG